MRAVTINDLEHHIAHSVAFGPVRSGKSSLASAALCLALMAAMVVMPSLAHASVTGGGGGMPYSGGVGIFNTSIRTDVAGLLIVIAIVAGVAGYLIQGQMSALMEVIGRTLIGIGVIGAVGAFATLAGVTGAVV